MNNSLRSMVDSYFLGPMQLWMLDSVVWCIGVLSVVSEVNFVWRDWKGLLGEEYIFLFYWDIYYTGRYQVGNAFSEVDMF